jgi:hypothetical protein
MAMTPFTLMGNSADSPEPIHRPLPATGHNADMLGRIRRDVGYDAEPLPDQPPQQGVKLTFHTGLLGGS